MSLAATGGNGDSPLRTIPQWGFLGGAALLFAASAAATAAWCASMPALCGLRLSNGWMLSSAWLRLPGQTWAGAALGFLGMWSLMMPAMMLPSLVPMLWRYRLAVGIAAGARLGVLTLVAALGYFSVWMLCGLAAFPFGAVLAQAARQQPALARAMPLLAGLAVVLGGALQCSAWKSRQLSCCRRQAPPLPAHAAGAWAHGLRLGLRCSASCAGLTAILLVLGVMDLRLMALLTAAISAERLLPAGERVARGIGACAVLAGVLLLARAAGFG